MKFYVAVLVTACSWLTSEAAFQFPSNQKINVYTEDMLGFGLAIAGQDESIYLGLLASNVVDFQQELLSSTLAAYKVSQEAGQCAAAIQQSTAGSLADLADELRTSVINAANDVRKVIRAAKTSAEISNAFEYLAKEKGKTAVLYSGKTVEQDTLVSSAMKRIQECV